MCVTHLISGHLATLTLTHPFGYVFELIHEPRLWHNITTTCASKLRLWHISQQVALQTFRALGGRRWLPLIMCWFFSLVAGHACIFLRLPIIYFKKSALLPLIFSINLRLASYDQVKLFYLHSHIRFCFNKFMGLWLQIMMWLEKFIAGNLWDESKRTQYKNSLA